MSYMAMQKQTTNTWNTMIQVENNDTLRTEMLAIYMDGWCHKS